MPDVLIEERDGPVATLTLNRPERLNAVTPGMIDALDTALARANTDPAVRVIRLRGAGRAFCAGYDIDAECPIRRICPALGSSGDVIGEIGSLGSRPEDKSMAFGYRVRAPAAGARAGQGSRL